MKNPACAWLLTAAVGLALPLSSAAATGDEGEATAMETPPPEPADRLLAALDPVLEELVAEVLMRSPEVARARAAAAAAAARAPQLRALPDPMAALTTFLLTPETRVGPQRFSVVLSQRLPWFGKLALREQQALYGAAAAAAEVAAKRLALVTETRRLAYELAFLEAQEEAIRADRETLARYEELARARYASGVGLEQAVVKLQAEITKDDNRLLDVASRRATLTAALNALRDRPPATPAPAVSLPSPEPLDELALEAMQARAHELRPEVARARSMAAAAATGVELAGKEYRPDVTLGMAYTAVGARQDPAGRAMPPPDNGDDVFGLTVGVNLPVWRRRLAAGVEEATALESAAEEGLRGTVLDIDRALGELVARLPLSRRQVTLFDDLLVVQAEEALRSAEAAYAAGAAGALDLLDAERVQLDVAIAAERTRADYWIALARLEGAVGAPIADLAPGDLP